MNIILDKIAIWKPFGSTTMLKREAPLGISYRKPDSAVYEKATKPIIRYAKDYQDGKTKFCLFVRTFSTDEKAVEKRLDEVAKKLDKRDILEAIVSSSASDFTYSDYNLDLEEE